jgi:hypothetical protein
MRTKLKAKPNKQPVEWMPGVGDRVTAKRHVGIYVISRMSPDGAECDMAIPRTEFEIFRVPPSEITLID